MKSIPTTSPLIQNKILLNAARGGVIILIMLLNTVLYSQKYTCEGKKYQFSPFDPCPSEYCYTTLEGECVCPCLISGTYRDISWSPPTLSTTDMNVGDVLTSTVYASSYWSDGQTVSNRKVILNSNLVMDISVTFKDCEFVIGNALDIRVYYNETLTIKESYLRGTTRLWGEIEVLSNAEIVLEDNYIEDGDIVVRARHNSTCSIERNRFNNNNVGVFFDGRGVTSGSVNHHLNRNHFNSTRNLKLRATTTSIFETDNKPYAAIVTANVSISIGGVGCYFFSINNHANGILGFGASMYLAKYHIINSAEDVVDYDIEGYGIALNPENGDFDFNENNSLYAYGWGGGTYYDVYGYSIQNVKVGIYNRGVGASSPGGITQVRTNRINNVDYGFKGEYLYTMVGTVNYMCGVKKAGYLLENSPFEECEIYRNTLELKNGGIGVEVLNCSGQYDSSADYYTFNITENGITGANQKYGVKLVNCNTALVMENGIRYHPLSNLSSHQSGIYIAGGEDVNTVENVIANASTKQSNLYGVHYDQVEQSAIECNLSETLGIGFNWGGINVLDIESNTTDNCQIGWHYEWMSQTEEQYHKDNRWLNTISPYDAYHNGSPGFFSVDASIITIGTNTGGYSADYDPYLTYPSRLRYLDGTYHPTPCEPRWIMYGYPIAARQDSATAIGKGGQGAGIYENGVRFVQELNLYSKIVSQEIPYASDAIYASFMERSRGSRSNVSDFYDAITLLRSAQTISPANRKSLERYRNQVSRIVDEMHTLDSQYVKELISLETYYSAKARELSRMHDTEEEISSIHRECNKVRNTTLSQAATLLEGISPNSSMETHFQDAYLRLIKYHKGELSGNDIEKILEYNHSCLGAYQNALPIYKGIAEAEGMRFDYTYDCEQAIARTMSEQENQVRIYPNPAGNVISLDFDKEYTGKVRVVDVTGRSIIEKMVEGRFHLRMHVADVSPGLYYIVLDDDRTQKFVKQ